MNLFVQLSAALPCELIGETIGNLARSLIREVESMSSPFFKLPSGRVDDPKAIASVAVFEINYNLLPNPHRLLNLVGPRPSLARNLIMTRCSDSIEMTMKHIVRWKTSVRDKRDERKWILSECF
jgi:hypothetical protein